MKGPSSKDLSLKDDYIASLFAAQTISVPDDLKQSVMEQAQRQLSLDAAERSTVAAVDNHTLHKRKPPKDNILTRRTQNQRFHSRARWFAVAATVLVAIAVTPMLLTTPDSSLNNGDIAQYDVDTVAPVATAESVVLTESVVTAESVVTTESAATESAATAEAVTAATSAARKKSAGTSEELAESEAIVSSTPPAVPMVAEQAIYTDTQMDSQATPSAMKTVRQKVSNAAVGGAAGDISSDSWIPYRQTADRWIEKIQRLLEENEGVRAQIEYRLFEEEHPDRARHFKPDFKSDFKPARK